MQEGKREIDEIFHAEHCQSEQDLETNLGNKNVRKVCCGVHESRNKEQTDKRGISSFVEKAIGGPLKLS